VTLALQSNGRFTLLLNLEGKRYEFDGGKFDLTGNFTKEIPRAGKTALEITLQLDLSGSEPGVVTGGVVVDGVTHSLSATQVVFDDSNPAPKGVYTLAIAPDPRRAIRRCSPKALAMR
jgi:hypothetical protein